MGILCRLGIHSRVLLPSERVRFLPEYGCRRDGCPARWTWIRPAGMEHGSYVRGLNANDSRRVTS